MKLNINKACDLSSISVLPPHSRRRSNPVSSLVDSSGSGQMQMRHMRSQSQQPFSQGMSLSQLSQGSLDDVLTGEQRLDSQERDNSGKRLAPISSSRDDSQMQQSRSSNYATRKWSSTFTPDPRCRVSEELEHKIGLVEGSLNRLERIMDSVQSDIMQVNKAVKEVSLEVAGIWQKVIVQDGHMQLMLKREEEIKASVSETLKSIPDQLRKEAVSAEQQKACKIAAAVSSLPTRIESCLLRFQNEICGAFSKEIEKRSRVAAMSQKNQLPVNRISPLTVSAIGVPTNLARVPHPKMEAETAKVLKPKACRFSDIKHAMKPKLEEVLITDQDFLLFGLTNSFVTQSDDFEVIAGSDEELDKGFCCLLKKKEAGWKSHLSEEAERESVRILRRARRRKRKLDNTIVLD
ncbi:hypothetical protein Taro_023334 [Colocasia esculenta]|uniref:Uncharacterized protein n=1 Tax=Colocasia esculenta TaxID=4460 RepID=A0A843VE55_COLES|nr:hypothetical protein [Colocasia esculenta]